jgi:hypothetical protein
MSEFLYAEPRKRAEDPFYVRVLDADEHHPAVDGKRAAFVLCDSSGHDLGEWMSVEQLRREAKKLSRAIPLEKQRVLVPV